MLRGAGATFPAPLYEKWIQTYRQQHPEVAITYDAVGSGEGQRRFLADAVDFGASDAALSDEQMARVKAGARLVPVTAGMVVLAYNLPGLGGPLKLGARRLRGHLRRPHPDLGRSPDPRPQSRPQPAASQHRHRGAPGRQRDDVRAHQSPERGQQRLARPGTGGREPRRLARDRHAGARQRRGGRAHQGQRGLDRLRGVPLRQAAGALDGPPPEQGGPVRRARTSTAGRPPSPPT